MEERYFPLTLKSLKDCFKDLPFDLYLQLGDQKYLKAFDKNTGLDFARLAHYEVKGVQYFYVHPSEAELIDGFLSRSPMMTLTHANTPFEAKKRAFFAVMEQSLFEAFGVGNLSSLNVNKAFEALKVSLQADNDFVSTISLLLKFCPKDDTFLKHAISTSVYSYVAAQVAGMTSERSMKIILFASLFHDLGKLKLPEDRRLAHQNKSLEEIAEFRQHPALTLTAIEGTLPFADEEVRTCILHHRERLDGKGYPFGLRGPAIFSLARIVSIGDALSELTLGMEDGHVYSRPQAIATMSADEGRFDKKLLSPFTKIILQSAFPKVA